MFFLLPLLKFYQKREKKTGLLRLCIYHHHHHVTMVQMSQKEQDIQMMLAAGCHLGTKNVNFQMERYGAFVFFFVVVSFDRAR